MRILSVTQLKPIQFHEGHFIFPMGVRTRITLDKTSRANRKQHQIVYQQRETYGTTGDCCTYFNNEQLLMLEEKGMVSIRKASMKKPKPLTARVKRTKKVFTVAWMLENENFVRRALSLGGMHKSPMDADKWEFPGDFGIVGDSLSSYEYKEEKPQHITIYLPGFDSCAMIWQDKALLQGEYDNEDRKLQYPSSQIDWINLLIEYGFVEVVIE